MFNIYDEFQPLRRVVVGRGYPAEYFDFIEDSQTRNQLEKIFIEIEEDFQNLINTIKSSDIEVTRPPIISKEEFQQHAKEGHHMMPPITPRDRQTVFGKKFVSLAAGDDVDNLVKLISSEDPENSIICRDPIMWGSNASSIFKMGRDIWFDESDWLKPEQSQWLIDNVLVDPRYRFHRMVTDGHSDCVFTVLKPGVILTTFHDAGVRYNDDFPGWSIHRINNPSIDGFWKFREEMHPGISWWVPGKDNLTQFRNYVDQYLNKWTGAIHETVFDVNCLSIDTKHVIFACYNKEVFDYCESQGIEPILCELRHRFFFDGGIHCVTLDLEREGTMEDYF